MTKTSKTRKPAAIPFTKLPKNTLIPSATTSEPDLNDLLVDGLKDLYWAENHLVSTLPKLQQAAGNAALRKAVGDHLKVTKVHVSRLEKAFELIGYKPSARKCDGMEGLAMEGEAVINSTAAGTPARDRGLLMACQKVEHYEMAAYQGLMLLASQLGKKDLAILLDQTLNEEVDADKTLTALAEKK